jgi:hypothetical protein
VEELGLRGSAQLDLWEANVFIGHYGASYAAKAAAPRCPLAVYFVAAQFLDVLFSLFVLTGIEKMQIIHKYTPYNPYRLCFMPYPHSLLGSLLWAIAVGAVSYLYWKRRCESLVLAAAIFSHFLLDVPVHTPDLPLVGENSIHVGFGLWNYPGWTLLLELVCLLGGWYVFMRPGQNGPTNIRRRSLLVLMVMQHSPSQPPCARSRE